MPAGASADTIVLAREDLEADGPSDPWRPSLDDVAFIQYTSGSTSHPKGVVLTHRCVAENIGGIHGPRGLDVTASDIGVSWLPLYHDMGLIGMSFAPLYGARPVVLMAPEMFVKRPVEWLRAITQYRATISYAPNFAYDLCVRRVKDRDVEGLDLSSWRVAGCGAEPVNAQTLAAFAEKFGRAGFRAASFLPSYGLAEHVLAATLAARDREPRVDTVSADGFRPDASRRRRIQRPTRRSPSSAADVHFPAMRCASFARTARTRATAKWGRSRWRVPLSWWATIRTPN